ncbi:MAG: NADAR family protein [Muribaculaceae bacterium]
MTHNKQFLITENKAFTKDDFIFFWGHTDREKDVDKSCLSQWHMCLFEVDGMYYNCTEQYMMAEKARLFGDEETRQQIMASFDPMTIKKLGRKVSGFVAEMWDAQKYDIVVKGNLAKFSQNQKMMEYMLGTGDKILVEASPKDTIWGIGLSEEAPEACNPSLWRGDNLLGFALMEVRDMLRETKNQM